MCFLKRQITAAAACPYFRLSATATATATVAPTMGLLPMPKKPIISTEETAFGGFLIGAQGFQKK